MLRLGTAKKTITPRHPVRLAGYATRNREYDSVLQDIYTRVYLIEEGKKQLLIVYGGFDMVESGISDGSTIQTVVNVGDSEKEYSVRGVP